MTMEIKEATPEALRFIAERLRDQDEVEVRLLTKQSPVEALIESEAASVITKVIYFDGIPAGVFGLGRMTDEVGVPWLLGTDKMVENSKEWLKVAPDMREFFHIFYPTLTNIVHEKNTKSIRWLRRLGFSFNPAPIPGVPGFIQFTRTQHV